jgi:hypothetical protein
MLLKMENFYEHIKRIFKKINLCKATVSIKIKLTYTNRSDIVTIVERKKHG